MLASNPPPDRYEPMPSLGELPGWLWRRTGPGTRALLAIVLVAALIGAVLALPRIGADKRSAADAERHERAALRAERIRTLRAEQRPRYGRSDALARAVMLEDLSAAVLADARARVRAGTLDGPIRRVACEPFPRTAGGTPPEDDPSVRRGRYSCLAVTSEFGATEESIAGVLGHRYRVLIDFATGRYALCKVAGQAGPSREQLVTTPRACGGR